MPANPAPLPSSKTRLPERKEEEEEEEEKGEEEEEEEDEEEEKEEEKQFLRIQSIIKKEAVQEERPVVPAEMKFFDSSRETLATSGG